LLIADDDPVVRSMLSMSIGEEFELVAAAGDAEQAIVLARETQPDVAVVDVDMPRGGGIRAVTGLTEVAPGAAIVILSIDETDAVVRGLLQAGAVSYLRKGIAPHVLAASLIASIEAHAAVHAHSR
jgi:DNA-binding NarL/FixJ family response regulator